MEPEIATEEETSNISGEKKLLASYLGLSFAIFLRFLPKSSISLISALQSRNRNLALKLFQAEEQLRQIKSRRKEDSKANARVVEIFASHRNGWQQEGKKLLEQIEASADEVAHLRARIDELEKSEEELRICVEKLEREVDEREEIIDFMSRKMEDEDFAVKTVERFETENELDSRAYASLNRECCGRILEETGEVGNTFADFSRYGKVVVSEGSDLDLDSDDCFVERSSDAGEMAALYGLQSDFNRNYLTPASTFWAERTSDFQDLPYESSEALYNLKHFVPRRESPWTVDDDESTGVSSKLKSLEQELLNLEGIGKSELSKVPSLMKKQAKRYLSIAGKIDDLCRRMQASNPCDPTLNSDFRTQRQKEFLLEGFHLQQRCTEARQKLTALQTEMVKSNYGDELEGQAKLTTRRSMDSIRNNLREIQRYLEIRLARIMGDLEGILARDGTSCVRKHYISRYPFVQ